MNSDHIRSIYIPVPDLSCIGMKRKIYIIALALFLVSAWVILLYMVMDTIR